MKAREILKQVKKLEISTHILVENLLSGKYHSVFRGQGIDFSEIREYRPGDDIRAIDWKVTARYNRPFVKEFVEERNLLAYFVLDLSGSANFGSNIEKRRKISELAASLMFAAMKNNDKVGLFISTDRIEKYFPARSGKRHTLKLLSTIVSYEPKSRTTDLNSCLSKVSKQLKKRSIVFIISDFMAEGFYKPIRIMKKKHDIIAIRITDIREKEMPDIGMIEVEDEETGEQLLIDTSDESFRKAYKETYAKKHNELTRNLRKMRVDLIEILTDQDYSVPLKKFFNRREKRGRFH